MYSICDRYQLGQLIGKGSFGSVYLAGDIVTRKIVAVKIINKKLVNDTKAIMNEILILHKCQHENIIKLENYHEDADFVYIIQELAVGGQLFKHIVKRQHYSEFHAKVIIRQLLSALKYLHTLSPPIVHMDIKPENILFTDDNEDYPTIKLTDFGFAQPAIQIYRTTIGCTPGYQAPETFQHNIITDKADIYSVGVLVFELLSGQRPFTGDSINEILQKQINNQWQELSGISSEASQFIRLCITLDYNSRPSAEQLLYSAWLDIECDSARISRNSSLDLNQLQNALIQELSADQIQEKI
ncbi:Kinase [Hexamita inflata]|uniref:Kinase n=1 Tax=Hexamita inflata TaxID=28002 RepID=A0ABP1JVE0_9EUKA